MSEPWRRKLAQYQQRIHQGGREVLELAPDRLTEAVLAETEQAHALRQVSPFAGVLSNRERWQILKHA